MTLEITFRECDECDVRNNILRIAPNRNFQTFRTVREDSHGQKSQFQSLIFHNIHIYETSNSREFLDKKLVFAPV